jgi:hypothetical protein
MHGLGKGNSPAGDIYSFAMTALEVRYVPALFCEAMRIAHVFRCRFTQESSHSWRSVTMELLRRESWIQTHVQSVHPKLTHLPSPILSGKS